MTALCRSANQRCRTDEDDAPLWFVQTDFAGERVQIAAFAVSLEPDVGSSEPVPTGAVLYQGGVTYADEEGAR